MRKPHTDSPELGSRAALANGSKSDHAGGSKIRGSHFLDAQQRKAHWAHSVVQAGSLGDSGNRDENTAGGAEIAEALDSAAMVDDKQGTWSAAEKAWFDV